MNKQFRFRKYFRNKYKMTDNELNEYMIMKHHLDHYPTRVDFVFLEPPIYATL